MNNNSKKSVQSTALFYIFYTALFAVVSYLVYGYFLKNGKTLICEGDTWRQHLKAAAYYSKWLRGVFYHIIHDHSLSFQTFAFGIGYGSDMYPTLQYYALGDILNLFSAFVKTEYIHIYFQVVMLLRAYLAGITFSFYAKYLRKDMTPTALMTGMFTYSFGSYFMYLGLWHPFFANPLIYLPLVLLGAERILKEKKPTFFAVAIFLAGTNNFYFFYIIVLLTIIYVLVRLIFTYFGAHKASGSADTTKKNRSPFSEAMGTVGTFFLYGITGTLMSMFILLTVLLAFPNNPRSGSGIEIPFLYPANYYRELIKNVYTFVYHGENDTQLGFTPVFVAALFLVVVRSIYKLITTTIEISKKKKELLKDTEGPSSVFFAWDETSEYMKTRCLYQELVFALLITAFLCLPFCGYVFAAFSYAVNRWAFACALFAGFVTAEFADFISEKITGLIDKKKSEGNRLLAGVLSAVILVITLSCIIKNGRIAYSPEEGNMVKDYMDTCTPEEMYAQLQSTEVQVVEENAAADGLDVSGSFYRYSGRDLVWNAAMLDGISSTQFFWSLADKRVSEYFKLMANNDQQNFAYFALDDRAILNSIAGVRYYSLRYNTPDQQAFVPYGYAPSYEKFNFGIYENPEAMPLGFTYSQAISESDFNALTPIEREEALLYGVVLPDEKAAAYPEAEPTYTSENKPYDVSFEGKIKEVEDGFKVKEAGAAAILTFEGTPNAETLVFFKNLNVKSNNDILAINVSTQLPDGTSIQKNIDYKSERSWYYSGWHDFIVDLGYSDTAKTQIRLTFSDKGTYSFDELAVYTRTLSTMHPQLAALKEHTLTDVDLHKNPISFATNEITGSIDTTDSEVLFLSIPYTKGWKAYVDGKKTELIPADTMFSALELTAGHHDIRLVYHTPGLLAGFILTAFGFILLIVLRKRAH
ncbi:YfhO family protein [Butyrivibrio sp. XPD2002]|uniref:YfhO family protein n=1 Tax=Butyrivibrio sp. XPD2002 TaxID=1280665 RepID=UPI0004088E6C|nr:YfhO family protein [Butyrivibrio sp. XPD2002]